MRNSKIRAARLAGVLSLLFLTPLATLADRTPLKAGWNLFSVQDDISLGKKAAQDAAKKLPLCNDAKVDDYLTQLGKRLVKAGVSHQYTLWKVEGVA